MKVSFAQALLILLFGTFTARAEDSKPNFVFVIADDLGWGDVGFHDGCAPTPHLDKLCNEGLELLQHYVAPVCSPTRTGLMTGRYWSRFGVTTPSNSRALPWPTVTLPRALQTAGYRTCLAGKWHLGSQPEWGPNHFGFDHSYGSLAGGVGPWNHRYKEGPYTVTWHRNEKLIEESGHVTDLITAEAVAWLKRQGEQPFFLYIPFTAVHLPVKEPDEWLARVPQTLAEEVPRQYAASIMHLDDAVGKIIAVLEETGQRENTLLVFTSDNGGSAAENNDSRYPDDNYPAGKIPGNNAPLRGKKGDLYEGGIRVPTIVSWPGRLAAGAKCTTPIHVTDWMPTFCSLAGYSPEKDLSWDGSDIWPSLAEQAPRTSPPLYWVGNSARNSAVRVGDWKLITHHADSDPKHELFNLAQDPQEAVNLADEKPDVLAELVDTMASLAQADGDSIAND